MRHHSFPFVESLAGQLVARRSSRTRSRERGRNVGLVEERVVARMALLLDCHPDHLHLEQRLSADLDFTPLERVQVVLAIEDAERCQVPLDEVASAVTIGDLVHVVEDAVRRAASARHYAGWLASGLRKVA